MIRPAVPVKPLPLQLWRNLPASLSFFTLVRVLGFSKWTSCGIRCVEAGWRRSYLGWCFDVSPIRASHSNQLLGHFLFSFLGLIAFGVSVFRASPLLPAHRIIALAMTSKRFYLLRYLSFQTRSSNCTGGDDELWRRRGRQQLARSRS